MADWETVRELASAFPDVEEHTSHGGRPALRVRKKLFAWMSPNREADGALALRVDPDEKRLIIESNPKVYFSTPHYEGYPAVLVRLEAIEQDELAERIEDAWLIQAPKRLAAEFLARSDSGIGCTPMAATETSDGRQSPSFGTIVREWGRIGIVGFGGPPAHIALLRDLCVERRRWIAAKQFEDAIAATNLLPGPASTQLAIFAAWRLRGVAGALVGGLCFIVPGLVLIVALAALFLGSPPLWVRGAGAGAGAAVAAVAVHAGLSLIGPAWRRSTDGGRSRFVVYTALGAASAATLGPWLVLVLLACGVVELVWRRLGLGSPNRLSAVQPLPLLALAAAAAGGGLASLAWVAFKVGALSYGGGFVIIPLMQADAVEQYHWMTDGEFLNAVALGQVTPGPVTHTVAVVGYAAAGVPGALLAASVAFVPSFLFVLLSADRFDRLLVNAGVRSFFDGAGPAAIGAILGSAIPLALALQETWQAVVLVGAAASLFLVRRGVVFTLLAAGAAGVVAVLLDAPVTG